MFCSYRSKRRDHIVRHAAKVHQEMVQSKIISGEIAGPNDAFIDEGDEEARKNAENDGFDDDEPLIIPVATLEGEESEHDSDYDEDTLEEVKVEITEGDWGVVKWIYINFCENINFVTKFSNED